MKTISILFHSLLISYINLQAQSESAFDLVPPNFVKEFYKAYSGIPTTENLAPFYHEEVVIDDPTYDWVGTNKQMIFKQYDYFDNSDYFKAVEEFKKK